MPDQLFSRSLKTETLDVSTVQNLMSVLITSGLFKATYQEVRSLPDGTVLLARTISVDRSPPVDFSALSDQASQLAEQYRQEDEDNKAANAAAVAAEATRWAALSPTDQQAEIDAAKAARQAAIDDAIAKAGLSDPTPTGVAVSVTPLPTPITPAPLTP